METEKIAKSYKDFILRFNVDCEQEDPVWCWQTSKSWENLSSPPDCFESDLQYQIEQLSGDRYGLYLASGTFKKGSIKRVGDRTVGRTEENLKRILEIPLDADYLHFILHLENQEGKEQIDLLEEILTVTPMKDFLTY